MTPYYEDDLVTLYHGDCRDVLADLPDGCVDLVLTDPPYGMNWSASGKTAQGSIAGDGARQGVRLVRQMLAETSRLLADDAHLLMFCHWESWPDFYDALTPYVGLRNALIWHKATGGMGNVRTNYLRDYEVILYGARGKRPILGDGVYTNVLTGFSRVVGGRTHPTEKPQSLLAHLATRHCPEGGTVLDTFAGTGSTLLAAKSLGLRGVGVEIDERYCEIAANRLSQGALFDGAA
jgi:site-specific DNA-methyltransferase (adenine-specific)